MNHTGKKPYQDKQVGKAFSKVYKLKKFCVHTVERNHIDTTGVTKLYNSIIISQDTHLEKPYKCYLCDKDFKLNFYLASHMEKKHHVPYIEMLPGILKVKN